MSQTSDKEKFRLLSEEVQSLLLKRVIEEIPLTQLTPGFYSRDEKEFLNRIPSEEHRPDKNELELTEYASEL
jgi:hypothetical protein